MELERKDLEHIAKLAHIDLPQDETDTFRRQVSSILEYVGKLSEVDVRGTEPTAHITGVVNVMREDVVRPAEAAVREALLAAAPSREGDYVKVKAVFH